MHTTPIPMALNDIFYIIFLFLLIAFYFAMGLRVLWTPIDTHCRPEEQSSLRHLHRAVACYLFMWAIGVFVFLPAVLLFGYETSGHYYFNLCFMLNLSMHAPCLCWIMTALLQTRYRLKWMLPLIVIPELAIFTWFFVSPDGGNDTPPPVWGMIVWIVISTIALLIKYYIAHKHYIRQLKCLYTDLSDRDVNWTSYAFGILAMQILTYIIYQLYFSIYIEILYVGFSIVTCTLLVVNTCKMRAVTLEPLIEDIHEEGVSEQGERHTILNAETQEFDRIELLLKKRCEDTLLYLNPQLSRDELCRELGINKNKLAHYFASRESSFYNYINHLRILHATQLIEEHLDRHDLPMTAISEQSGFANIVTFRKAFIAHHGCLPSEYSKQLKNAQSTTP